MNHQQRLQKIASQGLARTSVEEIQSLALAFWHREFVPDVAQMVCMDAKCRALAGYLIEFFSQFNCLTDERARALVDVAGLIRASIGSISVVTENPHDTAARWGLSENIYPLLKYIVEFQTRHYLPQLEI